jgi:hypothetical protein
MQTSKLIASMPYNSKHRKPNKDFEIEPLLYEAILYSGEGMICQLRLSVHYFPLKLYRLLLVYNLLGGGGRQPPPHFLHI